MIASASTSFLASFAAPASGGRLALAAATAFVVVLATCPLAIRLLRRVGARERSEKKDTEFLSTRHFRKRHTPTMGGLVILVGLLGSVAIWTPWSDGGMTTPIVCALLVAFATVGFVDDLIKMKHPTRKGLRKRTKMAALLALSLAASGILYASGAAATGGGSPVLQVPFLGALFALGPVFVLSSSVVVVGAANAVNLTDGLDGLASGLLVLSFSAFAFLAFVAGDAARAGDAGVLYVADGHALAIVAAASAGAALGFLVFNRHPARIFMGDTGALALGGGLGTLAVGIRQEVLLVLVGGVFVIEAGSVILQVWSFQRHGKRIFRCAPLHHHFEYLDWPERRITRCFWGAGAAFSALAVLGTWGA